MKNSSNFEYAVEKYFDEQLQETRYKIIHSTRYLNMCLSSKTILDTPVASEVIDFLIGKEDVKSIVFRVFC